MWQHTEATKVLRRANIASNLKENVEKRKAMQVLVINVTLKQKPKVKQRTTWGNIDTKKVIITKVKQVQISCNLKEHEAKHEKQVSSC